MLGLELAVMCVMVAANAVFAAYEIALATVSVARLEALEAERRRGAAAALRMKRNVEGSLAVVQLGITLVGVVAAATGGAGAEERIAPYLQTRGMSATWAEVLSITLIVVPLTAITIVAGELVPKLFALRNKEWICLKLSAPMSWFAASTRPAVWLLEMSARIATQVTERWRSREASDRPGEAAELQELRALASVARTSRLIGAREEGIIVNAVRLSSRPIAEIMLPSEHICMLHLGDSPAACLGAAHLDMHTRFPVTTRPGDPQAIVGYVNFKDLIVQARAKPDSDSLHEIRRDLPSLKSDLPIAAALESLMRHRTHVALVRDVERSVVGMVTLEDIFEELVGDIQDEYDLLPVYAIPAGDGWIAGGGLSMQTLREITGIDLAGDSPHNGVRTLSLWITSQLGRPPRAGDVVQHLAAWRIVVRKVRRQQVLEAAIQP